MTTLAAIHRDGSPIQIDAARVAAFRAALRGALITANDPGYHESRSVWNAMIDRRPALVARCAGVADIMAGVQFAREHGIALSIKGGGHNIAGLAVAEGGLVLDLAAMRGVWTDPRTRVARVQSGCLLGDVDRETQVHGLATVLGFVSATGVTGLTLGGGFGYASRRFGWTSDNVRAFELVTADGRVTRASEGENADLFWGLRGGGGNFGVVTGIEYDLHAIGPEIYGGVVAWPVDEAPRVLELLRALADAAPRELTLVGIVRPAPPAPWIDPSAHGRPIVALFACYTGSPEAGEKLLAPVKALGRPVGDILQRRSYVSQQCLLDATQPPGRRYYWKSEYLPGLSAELFDAMVEHGRRIVSPHAAVVVFQLGGAVGDRPVDHSAVGNRDAAFVLNVTAAWEKPEDDVANIAWARAAWEDMKRHSTGGTYINFLTEEEHGERIRAAYGANFARLAAVKGRWDPENLFRANKNIAPG